jgi:riboflavin synthase
MFTGIIEEVGQARSVRKIGAVTRIEIAADKVCEDAKIGDSISVNGVCLTIAGMKENIFSFDVIPETIRRTTLKNILVRETVNLERALKVGDRLGGHFVTGHVDFVGVIRSRKISQGDLEFRIGVPAVHLKHVIRKGSIAVDGISLTIADVGQGGFSVCIIPHTAKMTTLDKKHAGDRVNVELDMLAKR